MHCQTHPCHSFQSQAFAYPAFWNSSLPVNDFTDLIELLPEIDGFTATEAFDWIQPMQQLREMARNSPATTAAPMAAPGAPTVESGYNPNKALELARAVRGKRSDGLHLTPELRGAYRDPRTNRKPGKNLNDLNCANFVSALLMKSGGIARGTGSCNVSKLEQSMQRQGWVQRPAGELPQPGDVWFSEARGHVEIVSKVEGGRVYTTGSNNIGSGRKKPDGSSLQESGQWVTQRQKTSPGVFYTRGN